MKTSLRLILNSPACKSGIFLVALVFGSVALAQDADVILALPSWGTSILTFSAALAALTQAVKTRLKGRLERVPHYLIHGVTLAFGVGFAFLLSTRNLLVDPLFSTMPQPWGWLLYGTIGSVGAMGFYDLLKSLLGLAGAKATLPTPAPTAAQAEAQLDAIPKLAVEGLRGLAASFGIPGYVVGVLLNTHTLAEAERLIREMGAKRPLTEGETKTDQDAWAKEHPVRVTQGDGHAKG